MSVCRGCLTEEANAYHLLFAKFGEIPVKDTYECCTGLAVDREDGLPRYICDVCCKGLLQFHALRKQMLESNVYLRTNVKSPTFDCEQRSESLDLQIYIGNTNDGTDSDDSTPVEEIASNYNVGESSTHEEDKHEEYDDEHRIEYLEEAEHLLLASDTVPEQDDIEDSIIRCCGCPSIRFKTEKELSHHSQDVHAKDRINSNVRPYECGVCFKRYSTILLLERHRSMPFRGRNYQCNESGCEARFVSRSALYNHKKSKHSDKRSYSCDLCDMTFFTSSTLLSHRKIHCEKQYQCQTCLKMFHRQNDLLSHQALHLDELPFSCDRCDSRFKSRNNLRSHQRTHENGPWLACMYCDATFNTYNTRKVHHLSHKNIVPFMCDYCGKVYKRNFPLKLHIEKVHGRVCDGTMGKTVAESDLSYSE